jgi:hypothetical protein
LKGYLQAKPDSLDINRACDFAVCWGLLFLTLPTASYIDPVTSEKDVPSRQKKGPTFYSKPFIYLAPPDGLDPLT